MAVRYEFTLLSDLLKKSRVRKHPDFVLAMSYIYGRLENIEGKSRFNDLVRVVRKIIPRFLLMKLLYRLRYDAMIGFRQEETREVYTMVSFQRHPRKAMLGMFDFHVARSNDVLGSFSVMAQAVYNVGEYFRGKGYEYMQCGNNDVTRKVLRLYEKTARKKNWRVAVDVSRTRIYLYETSIGSCEK